MDRRRLLMATTMVAFASAGAAAAAAGGGAPQGASDSTVPASTFDIAAMDPDDTVPAAAAGLDAYLDSFPAVAAEEEFDFLELDECPIITAEMLAGATELIRGEAAGAVTLEGRLELYEETSLESELSTARRLGVVCGSADFDAAAVGLSVFRYDDESSVLQLGGELETAVEPSGDTFGGTMEHECRGASRLVDGTWLCVSAWQRDLMSIHLAVAVPEGEERSSDVNAALVTLLPDLLDDLATGLPGAGDDADTTEPSGS